MLPLPLRELLKWPEHYLPPQLRDGALPQTNGKEVAPAGFEDHRGLCTRGHRSWATGYLWAQNENDPAREPKVGPFQGAVSSTIQGGGKRRDPGITRRSTIEQAVKPRECPARPILTRT